MVKRKFLAFFFRVSGKDQLGDDKLLDLDCAFVGTFGMVEKFEHGLTVHLDLNNTE